MVPISLVGAEGMFASFLSAGNIKMPALRIPHSFPTAPILQPPATETDLAEIGVALLRLLD